MEQDSDPGVSGPPSLTPPQNSGRNNESPQQQQEHEEPEGFRIKRPPKSKTASGAGTGASRRKSAKRSTGVSKQLSSLLATLGSTSLSTLSQNTDAVVADVPNGDSENATGGGDKGSEGGETASEKRKQKKGRGGQGGVKSRKRKDAPSEDADPRSSVVEQGTVLEARESETSSDRKEGQEETPRKGRRRKRTVDQGLNKEDDEHDDDFASPQKTKKQKAGAARTQSAKAGLEEEGPSDTTHVSASSRPTKRRRTKAAGKLRETVGSNKVETSSDTQLLTTTTQTVAAGEDVPSINPEKDDENDFVQHPESSKEKSESKTKSRSRSSKSTSASASASASDSTSTTTAKRRKRLSTSKRDKEKASNADNAKTDNRSNVELPEEFVSLEILFKSLNTIHSFCTVQRHMVCTYQGLKASVEGLCGR
ncbi:hypothetical protein HK102_004966 [Quaeritorhiza haematococci]|nr:hypothetical protein HK102_004966 [Quaeritorhiza haematococci]